MEEYTEFLKVIAKGTRNESKESVEVIENRELELKLGPPGLGYLNSNSKENCCSLSHGTTTTFQVQMEMVCASSLERKNLLVGNVNSTQPNSFKKRVEERPIMGWPPVGSYRKVVARSSSFSKVTATKYSNNASPKSGVEGLYVKVNMDGVPIGRKIDLNAYNNYQHLHIAVHELFRGHLAAQKDTPLIPLNDKKKQEITEISESKEEYALVYEDGEGDRVLVGDIPWDMFVSSVRRLRLLKKSEVTELQHCSSTL